MQYNTAYCIWEDDTQFFSVLPLISALAVPLNVSYQANCLWIVQYVIWPVNPLVVGPFLFPSTILKVSSDSKSKKIDSTWCIGQPIYILKGMDKYE